MAVSIDLLTVSLSNPQRYSELRALPHLALDRQLAAHHPSKIATDRQTKPGARRGSRQLRVHLNERFEDRIQAIRGDPHARVANADHAIPVVLICFDTYRSAFGS